MILQTILIILAVWRLTSLFVNEVGPYKMFERIREIKYLAALKCFWCAAVWMAIPFAFIDGNWIINILAYSAGAIIVEEALDALS